MCIRDSDIKGYSLFVSEKNGDAIGSVRLAHLLGNQLRNACFIPTLHHAEKIPGESRELLDEQLGIYRFDDLVVLKSTRMPAVLFEAGLIVNRHEERLLQSSSYQKRIAVALTNAVVEFCEGGLPLSPDPVSYTHLDVYKRQFPGILTIAKRVGRGVLSTRRNKGVHSRTSAIGQRPISSDAVSVHRLNGQFR